MNKTRKRVLIKDSYGDNIQLMLTEDQTRLLKALRDTYSLVSDDVEIIEFDDESAWDII